MYYNSHNHDINVPEVTPESFNKNDIATNITLYANQDSFWCKFVLRIITRS